MKEKGIFDQIYSKKKDYLRPVYFDVRVLERYFEDPKYLVFYNDYRGSIIIDDDFIDNRDEKYDRIEYLKNFGLAYHKCNREMRAIVAFADELIMLPPKMQSHFHSYYLENQDDFYANEGFVKNLIYGEWVDSISIYQALTLELHYINEMCSAIGIPNAFIKEYSTDARLQNERPNGYHVILMPTKKRYYDFVITLEKMITGNINIKAFLKPVSTIKAVNRNNENGNPKPKLTLLVDWLKTNVRFANIEDDIEKPLRALIKSRQIPAHEIFENEYDTSIWKQQNDLMVSVYTAVRNIRLILANHPSCKNVDIPDYLYDGMHISID